MGKRLLFISGSIGLGHVTRDLAIAKSVRKLNPDVEILWLAEEPATKILSEAGERVLEEGWTNNNEAVAKISDDKNRFNLTQNMLNFNNHAKEDFQKYLRILKKYQPDLVVGDETYEIFAFAATDPATSKQPFVGMWDFIKFYSMTGNPMHRLVTYMINKNYHNAYKNWKVNEDPYWTSIFLGTVEDIPDEKLGIFMVNAREAVAYMKYTGYPIPFDPRDYEDKAAIRQRLGYGQEPLIVCSIGGTNTGRGLIDLCGRAYPLIKKAIPSLRMVMVAGPMVDERSLKLPEGIEVHGFVPRLYEHFAASDLAIVLGGGSTTLELMALQKPFIYFPLEKHSEQSICVVNRCGRYNAGVKMLFSKTTPEMLAEKAIENLGKKVEYGKIPIDGVKNAAEIIAQRL